EKGETERAGYRRYTRPFSLSGPCAPGGGSDQLALENLPRRGHRQSISKLDEPRILVACHLVLPPGQQILLGQARALAEDDERLDLLAVALVGDSDHCRQRDVG